MGWGAAIFTYVMIWWVALFMVLPFGIRRQSDPDSGTDPGAPETVSIKRKFLQTSVVSFILWLIVCGIIEADLVSFNDIANQLLQQDLEE